MALYKKKWWKNLFDKNQKKEKINVINDISAIKDFLRDLPNDIQVLKQKLNNLKELEKEYKVAKSGVIQVNLSTQAEIIEELLKRYDFLLNDADINSLRLKMIAKDFIRKADKAGLDDLVREKKKNLLWS